MYRIFSSMLIVTLMLSPEVHGAEKLNFQEFMAAVHRENLALQSSQERERIWDESEPGKGLGWDQSVSAEWRQRDFTQKNDRIEFTGKAVQGTPYGVNGTLQYLSQDPYFGTRSESVGMEIDLLRNRFGSETTKQSELLNFRKKILNFESIESEFQVCMQGLNSISRYVLLDQQEEIFHRMISTHDQLRRYINKRVAQGGLSRVDLLSTDAEIASLDREAQAVRQAKAEWVAVETNRLSLAFTGLEFPKTRDFLQFNFIPSQKTAWLPELTRLQQQIEESQTQISLLEEQSRGSLKIFGQAVDDLQGQEGTRKEFGLSIAIPLHDSARRREMSLQKLNNQSLRYEKNATEQKAAILLAETAAKVEALEQRLNQGDKTLRHYQSLEELMRDQYKKGAVGLERLFRQEELRLREELVQEQILFELRSARSLYVMMQQKSPNFCLGG